MTSIQLDKELNPNFVAKDGLGSLSRDVFASQGNFSHKNDDNQNDRKKKRTSENKKRISWKNQTFKNFFLNHDQDDFANKSSFIEDLCLFERTLSLITLIALLPIFLIVSIIIKLTSRGEIFFKQIRVGKDGRPFKIVKFRTMIQNAEKETGPVLSWKGDNRITGLGNFLRKTHLDELPQLINVVKGEMSLIGPRPERPELIRVFKNENETYTYRENVKPGITGLAQVCLNYNATANDKLRFDLLYIDYHRSVILNFLIAYQTIKKMVLLKNNCELVEIN
jgi:lipopolysaccharide/colanic/teichoic acid biosynthesis glycosyltransferase